MWRVYLDTYSEKVPPVPSVIWSISLFKVHIHGAIGWFYNLKPVRGAIYFETGLFFNEGMYA